MLRTCLSSCLWIVPLSLLVAACGDSRVVGASVGNDDANASSDASVVTDGSVVTDAAGTPLMDAGPAMPTMALTSSVGATAEAGVVLPLEVEVTLAGTPQGGITLEPEILAGGGSATAVVTGNDGRATVDWTLGVVPIDQRLRLSADGVADTLEVEVRAERTTPLGSESFGDVAGFLTAEGMDASTEDLVFADGRLLLGAPGGMLELSPDAEVSRVELTGDPIGRGWGIAAGADGIIWLIDADAKTLLRVDADGHATTVLDNDGDVPFEGLNDVEVGPDGKVYLTDPCLGRLVRYDPESESVDATHQFDLVTEGGPNGMAWDPGRRLYVTTENTLILCPSSPVEEYDDPLASIYRLTTDDSGFGAHEAVAEALGTFGDGLNFDAEGNLYAIIDTVDGLALGESAVVVLPGGEAPAQTLVVAEEVIYANLAFGHGEFGETTLYLALLQIPVVSSEASRGVQRVELGVRGAL